MLLYSQINTLFTNTAASYKQRQPISRQPTTGKRRCGLVQSKIGGEGEQQDLKTSGKDHKLSMVQRKPARRGATGIHTLTSRWRKGTEKTLSLTNLMYHCHVSDRGDDFEVALEDNWLPLVKPWIPKNGHVLRKVRIVR